MLVCFFKRVYIFILLPTLLIAGISRNIYAQLWDQNFSFGEIGSFTSIGTIIFVATSTGLLVSNDSGSHWTVAFNPRSADSTIGSLVSISNKLFAETGVGLLVSSDSGKSWEDVHSEILALFRNGSTLFGAVGGVYRSIDSGVSWLNVTSDTISVSNFAGVGEIIFAATVGQGVFRSTDNGLHWTNIIPDTTGVSYSHWNVAIVGSNVLATASGTETAYLSSDSGSSWKTINIPTPLGYIEPDLLVLAASGSNIFAGYDDEAGGVTLSIDTAKTWHKIGNMHHISSIYIFGGYIFAGTWNTGLYRSSLSNFIEQQGVHQQIGNIPKLTILSNPITFSADFQFDALQEPEVFELFDALGRSASRQQLPAGQTSLHVDMQHYPAGIYFAHLSGESVKVIKN
jgi:photosystem II stability/assembly factor-like uncharacterized protein